MTKNVNKNVNKIKRNVFSSSFR